MAEPIGVAFPAHEGDREALRRDFPGCTLPRARPGAHVQRCYRCRLAILVGPRLRATGLRVICPRCAHHLGIRGFWPRPTH
jgi:hypothetical protein